MTEKNYVTRAAYDALARRLAERDARIAEIERMLAKHVPALSDIVRMPNAEHVADAHNSAVRAIRGLAPRREGK